MMCSFADIHTIAAYAVCACVRAASDLAGTATRCIVATGRPAIFLPRYIVRGGRQPSTAEGTKSVAQGRGLDGGAANPAVGGVDASERAISSAVTSEAMGESSGAFTDSRGESAVGGCDDIPKQADRGVDDADVMSAAVKDKRAKRLGRLVPLDLALYFRKSKAESTANMVPASPSEKMASSRKFLVELAGQDPGDVHGALSLDSCDERPSHVVVSDDFLDKVRRPLQNVTVVFTAMLRYRVSLVLGCDVPGIPLKYRGCRVVLS